MEANSVIEFLEVVEENPVAEMYRGQLDFEWLLVPAISRFYAQVKFKGDLLDFEDEILGEYEKYAYPYLNIKEMSKLEKVVNAQHFGLPTRLLDWTTNPLKALYFAVEDPAKDNKHGVVHFFTPKEWYEGTSDLDDFDQDKEILTFFPEVMNERIGAQEGGFVSFPIPKASKGIPDLDDEAYIKNVHFQSCVYVLSNCKKEIRRELNVLGVNHRTIYPGLEGVAKWVKSKVSGFKF